MLEKLRLVPLSLLLLIGCRGPEETRATEDPITGGRIDRSHEAVGQVGAFDGDAVGFFCTGTLVGPKTVVTAAHCLFDGARRVYAPELAFEVGGVVHRIARSSVNPGYDPGRDEGWEDAAILRLEEASEVGAIPVSIDPPLEGVEADVVGFGVTRASGPGQGVGSGRRRHARIALGLVTDREIFYDASASGACYGDSGGPILQNGALVGVTSRGTGVDCHGIDVAQRADVLSVWIGGASGRDACIGWCDEE